MTPFEPPRGNPRFPLLDALRAIAALSVLAFHIGNYTGANQYAWYGRFTDHLDVGVAIFFVISGFVLYRPFIVARHGGPQRGFGDYAVGRALRLMPGYWTALTIGGLVAGLPAVFGLHWWVYYGLLQSYWPSRTLSGLPQAWSLVVEVSFYALLPLYVLALRRLPRTRFARHEVTLELLLLAALSAACLVVERQLPVTTIIKCFNWFAAGMAVAAVSAALDRRPEMPGWLEIVQRRSWIFWAAAIGCFLLLSLGLGLPRIPGSGGYTYAKSVVESLLWSAIGAFAILPAVLPGRRHGLVVRVLGNRVLTWLGLVSYGVYLWQWPVLRVIWKEGWSGVVGGQQVVSYLLLGVPATIICAALSWYVVERPALSLRKRLRPARVGRRQAARAQEPGPGTPASSGRSAETPGSA